MTEVGISPPPVVLESGSSTIKIGLATHSDPQHVVPNVIGRPRKQQQTADEAGSSECHIGSDAIANRDRLVIKHPVQSGCVCSWDDMLTVWNHALEHLMKVGSGDQPLLLVDCALSSACDREKKTQVSENTKI